jgi:hypothetical protein
LVFGASIRPGSRRIGNLDIALLAANRRLTIGAPRAPRRQGFGRGDCPTEDLTCGTQNRFNIIAGQGDCDFG